MGINTRICVLKKVQQETEIKFLQDLKLNYHTEATANSFDYIYGEIRRRNREPLIALSEIDKFWIFIDDYGSIPFKNLINYIQTNATEFIVVENSDTTGTSYFAFYKNGVKIREKAEGLESFIIDTSEIEGTEDAVENMKVLSAGKGELQVFEKEGSDGFTVLKNYAVDYFELDKMSWNLYKLSD